MTGRRHAYALGTLVTLATAQAHAWQIEDPIHHACHERISQAALTRVGYVAAPPKLAGDDARLRDNLEFDASRYDANIFALSLVLGVRNADTHGGPDFSFSNNASAANADDDQKAHCLRTKSQDGAQGDAAAVADCRAWIESLYWQALATLDDDGDVSAEARTDATVATQFQGSVSYPLSGFYYFAGRAIHAVQDSFTHSFRSTDGKRIRHVFNWSEQVSCTLDESRDGHGHETVMDDCQDGDPSERERFSFATLASEDFLRALTLPGHRAERAQRIADFLETWMSYEPDCTLDNSYCQSRLYAWLERSERSDRDICEGPLGCQSAAHRRSHGGTGAAYWLFGLVLVLMHAARRHGRGAATRLGGRVVGWLSLAALCSLPRVAAAEPRDDEEEHAPPPPSRRVGGPRLEARGSLSVDNPAFAVGLAGLYGFRRADVGAFAELNPWYGLERRRLSLGATNLGLLGHYLHPLRRDLILRFGVGVGISLLNADMLGVNAGNLGVFLDLRAMGLIWELGEGVALTADPLDLALPAPGLTGWPILWTQHRFSLGLQFSL